MRNENSTNPVALRSREQIIQALLELMQENEYSKITIKEIVFKAQLVRRTFYGHFAAKDDVLQAYFEDMGETYFKDIGEYTEFDIYLFVKRAFEMAYENKDAFFALRKSKFSFPLHLLETYQGTLNSTYPERITDTNFAAKYQPFVVSYLAGGLLNVVNKWIDNGMLQSPQEMAELFVYLEPSFVKNI